MDFHITYILNNKSLDEIWIKIVLGGPRNGEECEADTFVPDSSCEQVHVVVVLSIDCSRDDILPKPDLFRKK